MEFFMNLLELFVRDVRIYLRGLNVGMAKHHLHAANIGTVLE